MKIGIFFGGSSREREVSFAGGRTVYDNLNKSIFEPVPIFVDSFNNFILLDWSYIYKGSIRDFYPPIEALPDSEHDFQIYAEGIGDLSPKEQIALFKGMGKKVTSEELPELMDFAFLALHGSYGEDGYLQGLLEWLEIPYSGSGVLPSAVGIQKRIQKDFQVNAGFNSPAYISITRDFWRSQSHEQLLQKVIKEVGLPCVLKPANQGSSIGISILSEPDLTAFEEAINNSFFIQTITHKQWTGLNEQERVSLIQNINDIREGIGMPLTINGNTFYHPETLLKHISTHFASNHDSIIMESTFGEHEVLFEAFIEGREFSCIVIQDDNGHPIALPPTEIVKGKEVFDYRSKYLPGLTRKVTPIDLEDIHIENIRKACVELFNTFRFNVYARIDGFIKEDGSVYLNDPNTTSGMMPSSFFFHQAAEIGLNPSQFLSYIINRSLAERAIHHPGKISYSKLQTELEKALHYSQQIENKKIKIAVVMGGYSSERHISVESGRNIYEKLASSSKYEPIPIFLTGSDEQHELFLLPINILLKDNADDIAEKVKNFKRRSIVDHITQECSEVVSKYTDQEKVTLHPQQITYDQLSKMVEGVFIALHGRPGEDGAIQQKLEKYGLPYNGSGVNSSQTTINKYRTNRILKDNGFLVADNLLIQEEDWLSNQSEELKRVHAIGYPIIAKPADDGCSSAVKKITNDDELKAFAALIFRNETDLNPDLAEVLKLMPKEEFPQKCLFMIEKFVDRGTAKHFLEITGGLLTHKKDGQVIYEVFEPSEALAESGILSLEEKFLAGQGQNITPSRFDRDPEINQKISYQVREKLREVAELLQVEGYARIDAFVRIYENHTVDVIFIEVNSLPGMTPATCIFHQSAINNYKPYEFIDSILEYGFKKERALA